MALTIKSVLCRLMPNETWTFRGIVGVYSSERIPFENPLDLFEYIQSLPKIIAIKHSADFHCRSRTKDRRWIVDSCHVIQKYMNKVNETFKT